MTTRRTWLLLLPCPPSDVSFNTLRVAYGPGLTEALKQASEMSNDSLNPALDIAVVHDKWPGYSYSELQRFFGALYKLICVLCTEQCIDLEYGNDVDVRAILVRRTSAQIGHVGENIFIDLQTLANTDRDWQCVLAEDGENAEELLKDFLQARNQGPRHGMADSQVKKLPGGLLIRNEALSSHTEPIKQHLSVAVGGTFDHLHAGHKLLLTMTALVLKADTSTRTVLTIGITGDKLLLKKQYREEVEDFYKRQSAVHEFLLGILELISSDYILDRTQRTERSELFGREVQDIFKSGLVIKYVEIFDACGPTITDEAISALILSTETKGGGQAVNDQRRQKGWSPLEIFEVDVLDAGEDEKSAVNNDFQGKISSTDIRRRIHQKSATTIGKP